jgi:hypothetical protein
MSCSSSTPRNSRVSRDHFQNVRKARPQVIYQNTPNHPSLFPFHSTLAINQPHSLVQFAMASPPSSTIQPTQSSSETLPSASPTQLTSTSNTQSQSNPPPDSLPITNSSSIPISTEADLDAEMDVDVDMLTSDPTQPTQQTTQPPDSLGAGTGRPGEGVPGVDVDGIDVRVPQKKDASLREFLGKMDEYGPIVCLFPSLLCE